MKFVPQSMQSLCPLRGLRRYPWVRELTCTIDRWGCWSSTTRARPNLWTECGGYCYCCSWRLQEKSSWFWFEEASTLLKDDYKYYYGRAAAASTTTRRRYCSFCCSWSALSPNFAEARGCFPTKTTSSIFIRTNVVPSLDDEGLWTIFQTQTKAAPLLMQFNAG